MRQVCSGPSSPGAEALTLQLLLCPFPTEEEEKQEVQDTTLEFGWEVEVPSSAPVQLPGQQPELTPVSGSSSQSHNLAQWYQSRDHELWRLEELLPQLQLEVRTPLVPRHPSPCPPVPAELAGKGDPSVRAMPEGMHEGKCPDLLSGRGLMGVPIPLPRFPHALLGAPVASLSCRSACRQ